MWNQLPEEEDLIEEGREVQSEVQPQLWESSCLSEAKDNCTMLLVAASESQPTFWADKANAKLIPYDFT